MPERPDGAWSGGHPIDPIEMVTRAWDDLRRRFGGGGRGRINPWFIVAIALPLYALSGIFILSPNSDFFRYLKQLEPAAKP